MDHMLESGLSRHFLHLELDAAYVEALVSTQIILQVSTSSRPLTPYTSASPKKAPST